MNSTAINKLQWNIYRIAERLGVLGYISLGLLCVALLAYFILLRPTLEALDAAENNQPLQAKSALNKGKTDAEMYDGFLKSLPPASQRSAAVDALMAIAAEEGLEPNEVTYKLGARIDDPISHYHVEFRLNAPYADIQHFMSLLLHEIHYISIESLKFSRQSVHEENVDAQIHLAFHFNQL